MTKIIKYGNEYCVLKWHPVGRTYIYAGSAGTRSDAKKVEQFIKRDLNN